MIMAPKKIYFNGQQNCSNPFIGLMAKHADTDIEYVRTDAFVEEVIDWLNENWRKYVWLTDDNIIHFGHWKNDFKKAMEGG